jgi:transcriptional regulator with XRE-family HTH domain
MEDGLNRLLSAVRVAAYEKMKRGFTQSDIARAIKVDSSTISRFFSGANDMSKDNLLKLADWAEMSIDLKTLTVVTGNTMDNIRRVILSDTSLSTDSRVKLYALMLAMYSEVMRWAK